MLIQTRVIVVAKGYAEEVAGRFSQDHPVDSFEGLIDRTIMVNTKKKDQDEVVVIIRWASAECWKNWEKSDVHLNGHRENRGKEDPEYVISKTVTMYEVVAVKEGNK